MDKEPLSFLNNLSNPDLIFFCVVFCPLLCLSSFFLFMTVLIVSNMTSDFDCLFFLMFLFESHHAFFLIKLCMILKWMENFFLLYILPRFKYPENLNTMQYKSSIIFLYNYLHETSLYNRNTLYSLFQNNSGKCQLLYPLYFV